MQFFEHISLIISRRQTIEKSVKKFSKNGWWHLVHKNCPLNLGKTKEESFEKPSHIALGIIVT